MKNGFHGMIKILTIFLFLNKCVIQVMHYAHTQTVSLGNFTLFMSYAVILLQNFMSSCDPICT